MTRKTALAFGIGASLILAAGTASADCATEVQALQQQLGMTDTTNATIGASDPGVQQPDPGASTDMSAADSTTTDTTTGGSSVTAEEDNDANATIGATDPGVQQPDPGASTEPTDLSSSSSTSTTTTTDTTTTDTTTTDAANADGSSVTTEDTTGANATIGATDPGVQQPQNEDMNATADSSGTVDSSGSTTVPSGTVGSGTVTETTRSGELTEPADSRSTALAALKKAQLYADAGQEDACMSELSIAKQHMGVE
jgi:hypothetical protein